MPAASVTSLMTIVRPPEECPVAAWVRAWLGEFQAKSGRPLRVLHIGNIANYAFNNAKIMRRWGIDADVIDDDFYHIMGAPEWEEALVDGDFGAEYAPDWWGLDLHGYQRPEWFIQGPAAPGFAYQYSRRSGHRTSSVILRRAINLYRWQLGSRGRAARLVRSIYGDKPMLAKHVALRSIMRMFTGLFAWFGKRSTSSRRVDFGPSGVKWPAEQGGQFGAVARADDTTEPNLIGYRAHSRLIAATLAHYDIVQGYVLSGVYPGVVGFRNYAVYELGTLRDVPFQDDAMGRICAWVYRSAPHVFVTNIDCIEAARRLGLAEEKTHPVLHAFDCDKAFEYSSRNRAIMPVATDPPVFLAPARHHWVSGHSSWRKGNDIIIIAARRLADRGLRFRITFVDWGQEVSESRRLIGELGIEDYFEWVKPVSKPVFWPRYMRAVGVIDQFVAPALGGIALEALALGRPLLTHLDFEATKLFFTEPPPIFNVSSVETLAEAMATLIADPYDAAGIGNAGQVWMLREHSVERQLAAQLEVYQQLLAADRVGAAGSRIKAAADTEALG
jgi:glycosyltransferase involved in cell wall biosynthesis